jgi:hypothetical protein
MMLRLSQVAESIFVPLFQLLPKYMDSDRARVMLLAIGLQESGFTARRQYGNGPARSFFMFEPGGVRGIWKHHTSAEPLRLLCRDRDCNFDPMAIWARIEDDDVLGAGCARLLLLTDPKKLPEIGDEQGALAYYDNLWRPGKKRPEDWPANYAAAVAEVKSEKA